MFYVNSKKLLFFMCLGLILTLSLLIDVMLEKNILDIFIYVIINIGMLYVCYISSFSIELTSDYFLVKNLFFTNEKKYKINQVKKIILKTDYTDSISNIVIFFNDDSHIQIHKFQSGFRDALSIIRERFKETMVQYK